MTTVLWASSPEGWAARPGSSTCFGKRVPPSVQKTRLRFNGKALSPRRGPKPPGGWRTPLCRAPAARSGGLMP